VTVTPHRKARQTIIFGANRLQLQMVPGWARINDAERDLNAGGRRRHIHHRIVKSGASVVSARSLIAQVDNAESRRRKCVKSVRPSAKPIIVLPPCTRSYRLLHWHYNAVTFTFDLLTSESMHGEGLPCRE